MPTIPTPFIGGADSPQRDTGARRELAPPYHPGSVEPAETIEPAVEQESAEGPWVTSGADDAEATVESVAVPFEAAERAPEPEEREPEAPGPVETAEPQEAEPSQVGMAEVETVSTGWAAFTEPAPAEAVAEEVGAEPLEDTGRWTESFEADVEAPAGEPGDFPAFLFGPDGTGVDEGAAAPSEVEVPVFDERPAEAPEPAPSYETAERLAEVAQELLASDEGPRIRALIDDLRRLTADIAVPRAFAAGHLAAQRRQEKE